MEPRFIVDARGQLVAEDAQAKQALSTKAGQFFLAPTSPDLLFLVRTRAGGGQANPPRVVMAGDASAFPISDLIAFLSQSRWSGRLRLQTSAGERSIYLKDGEVKGASSEDPADRLGEVIVRLGYLGRKQLEDVLSQTGSARIGRALVDKRLLQPHDLWKCLTQQLSDIFHAIVLCREGAFLLIDQEFEPSVHVVQVSTQSLLMDSIRKIDEMTHFRKRIPNPRVYVTRRRASDGKLEKEEDRVLALANGERTVLELGQAAKLSEFDVTKIIFRLLEGGYVGVSDRLPTRVSSTKLGVAAPVAAAASARQAPPSQPPVAVVRIFNFIFREIRDEVAKKKMETEFIAAANAALARRALSASPVLVGLSFDKDGNLPEQRVLKLFEDSRAQLGSEPVASLKQALSDVMFFLLFQAGELLESRADEDLARRVKELLATIEA
jgi:hypothetical protein